MESDNYQIFEATSSNDSSTQMTTIHSTSTDWAQATVWVESGKVQLPEVTIYSYLQPIEMASYPDPIMSATGTNLQYLLSQEHMNPSTSSASDTESSHLSSTVGVSVIPVTYTTEYLTTTLITIYPTNRLWESAHIKIQPSATVVPTSTASIDPGSPVQPLSASSSHDTSTMNAVVPTYVEKPAVDIELDLRGRDEPARSIISATSKSSPQHEEPYIEPLSFHGHQNIPAILMYILSAILITSLIIHLFLLFRAREDSTKLSYTTKPPRPGLRKRLSLSISMTTGRRPSIASTNPTEATYVSGNAVSIGKAGGKGFGIGDNESEVRRTPSMPLLEV